MRFPSRLLASTMVHASMLWAGFLAVVAVIVLGIAVFGRVTASAWEKAAVLPRWYVLFVGIALIREFLPLYVAHGQTRRRFGVHAAVTVTLLAPFLSALLVVGYLIETGVYSLAGWEQALDRTHLFGEPTQLHLVFLEYALEFLVWLAGGAFIGAAYYRWEAGGLLIGIPVGAGLILLTQAMIGADFGLPVVGRILESNPPGSLALAVAVGLASFVTCLALTWSTIRDIPLRNNIG
ncbi:MULTISPECIES: hypothetical protein [unclassified Plantactinospora]|uniref:hypothetical protein n=1 Tax=unclassified Plantactinospora TaxID=2631981 RepID=UPI000D166748|nr:MULTISPECIES: hypothetical protein [unclassified Plantactinospora]AVT30399.1 hypothetical protein C6361_13855 [Plantactinospora sp. BC1]AVT36955.1 hypothetical protein C6W10_11300 [Plantactinospora sp. BB1]